MCDGLQTKKNILDYLWKKREKTEAEKIEHMKTSINTSLAKKQSWMKYDLVVKTYMIPEPLTLIMKKLLMPWGPV